VKILVLLLAVAGLSGCVAIPIAEPSGLYIGLPVPAVVVGPYGGRYAYRGGHRGDYGGGYRGGNHHRGY